MFTIKSLEKGRENYGIYSTYYYYEMCILQDSVISNHTFPRLRHYRSSFYPRATSRGGVPQKAKFLIRLPCYTSSNPCQRNRLWKLLRKWLVDVSNSNVLIRMLTWKDNVSLKTTSKDLTKYRYSTTVTERWLIMLGYVFRMHEGRHRKISLVWIPELKAFKRRSGRQTNNWKSTILKDLGSVCTKKLDQV